jgi:hypothetical protein
MSTNAMTTCTNTYRYSHTQRCLVSLVLVAMPVATRGFMVTNPRHYHVYPLTQSLEENSERPAHRGWRRVLGKALKHKKPRKDSVFALSQKDGALGKGATVMNMATVLENELTTSKLLSEFDRFSPSDIFPNLTRNEFGVAYVSTSDTYFGKLSTESPMMNVEEYEDELLVNLDAIRSQLKNNSVARDPIESMEPRSTVIKVAIKNWIEALLLGLFERWSVEPVQSLKAVVVPKGNVVSRILRGKFKADVEITFAKLVLKPIQLSGGSIQAKRLLLNLWSFTPDLLRKGAIRYPAQFDFHFTNCVFSEEDLIRSRSIRNGLQQLLARLLTRVGVSPTKVVVNSIRLLVSSNDATCFLHY